MKRLLLLFAAIFIFQFYGTCQLFPWQEPDTTEEKKSGIIALPVLFLSPETSLGFGAATFYYFRTDTLPETKPSNIQAVGILTLEKQLIAELPTTLFFQNNNYWFTNNLSFYIYPYQYYGSGGDISLDVFDPYDVTFLRIESNLFRRIGGFSYFGPTFRFEKYFSLTSDSPNGLLTDDVIGFGEGVVSGLGFGYILDKRNNLFCPDAGYFLQFSYEKYGPYIGSDFEYSNLIFDARKYFEIGDRSELAFQFYHQSAFGSKIPFYGEAQLGGSSLMRGYYRGAYRDEHFTTLQSEFRFYIFNRIVGSTFASMGSIADDLGSYDVFLPSGGIGFRYEIDPKEKIRIRADFAIGRGTTGFYLNINEAF